ncbi:MAG: cell division protein [Gammaproteobacteria bacterium RIFOXYB2_FULL_38_6]|nr:MAG: cell division protein [Gammaproteobacteria bacterium RIFOXYB2_FULL_38_6]
MRTWRFYTLLSILFILALILMGRLIDLNLVQHSFLLKQSQARILRTVSIPAYRGMIVDRNGQPLAVSTPVDSVWINPQEFSPSTHELFNLAKLLNLSADNIAAKEKENTHREFVYLERDLPPETANRIRALNISGVYFQREYKRYYPEGEVNAHVIGFTNIDDQGQEGLELAYNSWLSGVPGKKRILKDRLGNTVANVAILKEPSPGHDLQISIDQRIQYIAYYDLKQAIEKYHAQAGSIVVLNPNTGEILAMVNQPSYNPNNRPNKDTGQFRNRAVTDIYEPGSTIKPFNMTLALESGKYTPDTKIDTNPGWMMIDGHEIRDDGLDYGVITLTQLLQKSSNVGAAKVMLSLSPQNYFQLLHRVGFSELTGSNFPGEASGSLVDHLKWRKITVATLAFGYGISVTPLQLARAYAVFADDGIERSVTFLKINDNAPEGTQVIPKKTADTVLSMMESVVQQAGTGYLARVPGYRVAGKTGTAYIAGSHGYDGHHYMSSFVGIAPVSHPQLVVAVVIRNPQGKHFGGEVAAPVFAQVMSTALRLLDVPPDAKT